MLRYLIIYITCSDWELPKDNGFLVLYSVFNTNTILFNTVNAFQNTELQRFRPKGLSD